MVTLMWQGKQELSAELFINQNVKKHGIEKLKIELQFKPISCLQHPMHENNCSPRAQNINSKSLQMERRTTQVWKKTWKQLQLMFWLAQIVSSTCLVYPLHTDTLLHLFMYTYLFTHRHKDTHILSILLNHFVVFSSSTHCTIHISDVDSLQTNKSGT